MKRKIIIVLLLASVSVPSHAQFWKKLGNALKEVAVGVLYGAVDNMVQNSGDQQTINNWSSIKKDIAPDYSYRSEAGNQLGHGDTKGAIISMVSAGAEAAGVSADIVALGNAGLNNWVNGDNTAAIIDVGQMVTHVTGNYQFDYFFDTHREYNQINRDYRMNIQNGMSSEDAKKIRNDRLAEVIVNATEFIQNIDAERRARVIARKNEVKNALLSRGYSGMEADYLSTYLSIEDIENDNTTWVSADEMLDYHHIDYRESSEGNVFFDDVDNNGPSSNTGNTDIPIADNPPLNNPESNPILKERENAIKMISQSVLDLYSIDDVELSESQKSTLDQVAEKMNQFNDIQVVIVGHTCNIGTQKANQSVGERRAKEAKYYLIGKGVSGLRILTESRDYSEPVVDNDTEDHRKQNRRVTFEVK